MRHICLPDSRRSWVDGPPPRNAVDNDNSSTVAAACHSACAETGETVALFIFVLPELGVGLLTLQALVALTRLVEPETTHQHKGIQTAAFAPHLPKQRAKGPDREACV